MRADINDEYCVCRMWYIVFRMIRAPYAILYTVYGIRNSPVIFLCICCVVLFVLWLPGLQYPIVSDALHYVRLGESLWEQGRFALNGLPHANQLPLHAFLSYPLTYTFGLHLGMHMSSLFGGFGVLIATFLLARRVISLSVAKGAVLLLLLHPGFVLMSMLGSADLLFTTLFLFSLYFFHRADHDARCYIAAGLALGLACLTRYNGVPIFAFFFLWTAWKRRAHFRSSLWWAGMLLGMGLASLWFIRNALVFGNPLYSNYLGELEAEAPNPFEQFLSNALYYVSPLHNVFPGLFLFALFGLWRHAKRQSFLFFGMLTAWPLTAIWWVQAIRFAFPGYPLLLTFTTLGLADVLRRVRTMPLLFVLLCSALIAVQGLSLCLYTYGPCNAFFDRHIGIIPANMGLTPEGFHAWNKAHQFINDEVHKGAVLLVDDVEAVAPLFRDDFRLQERPDLCPYISITQRPGEDHEILFQTQDAPVTYVVRVGCQNA